MKRFHLGILLIITLLLNISLEAQNNSGVNIRRADKFYDQFNFLSAIDFYKAAIKKNEDNLYVKGRIGNCYKLLSNLQEAEKWYEPVALSSETDPVYKFYYAQSLMANGKYNEAVKQLNNYYTIMGQEDRLVEGYPNELLKLDPSYTIKIEDFNSENADFSPFQIRDELFFISNRNDDAILLRDDVWSARPFTQLYRISKDPVDITEVDTLSKNKKPEVYNKSSVSKRYHEGPISYDQKQHDIYMTRSNYKGKKAVKGADDEVNLKIVKLVYIQEDKKTGEGDFGGMMVDNLSFSSDEYSVAYPAITVDGNYMIFSSDMPGGFGGLDLYVANNLGGIWSNPINLGELINTPGNDAFPYIMDDGTMFFASDGRVGLGAYDIYMTRLKEDGYFSMPVNMKSPINSSYDDFGIWVDDTFTNGYFTSNRPDQYKNDNIYSFTRQSFLFEAIVFDSKTEALLDSAEVVLINLMNGKEYPLITDAEGYVSKDILPNSKYTLKVNKTGYLPEEAAFSTTEDNIYAEIPLIRNFGILLDVNVVEKDTEKEIPFATLTLKNLKTKKELTVTTDEFGKATFELDANVEYSIKASKEILGVDSIYLAVTNEFNTKGVEAPAQLYTTIELQKECIGGVECEIVIEDILYDLDKFDIRPDAALILNNLVKVLKDNPSIEIELASHTDCRGTAKYNMWLSAKRAEAAVNYLIQNGINYRRLTAAGYGETKPLLVPGTNDLYCTCEGTSGPGKTDPRCTEDIHQANRRTTFTILKK